MNPDISRRFGSAVRSQQDSESRIHVLEGAVFGVLDAFGTGSSMQPPADLPAGVSVSFPVSGGSASVARAFEIAGRPVIWFGVPDSASGEDASAPSRNCRDLGVIEGSTASFTLVACTRYFNRIRLYLTGKKTEQTFTVASCAAGGYLVLCIDHSDPTKTPVMTVEFRSDTGENENKTQYLKTYWPLYRLEACSTKPATAGSEAGPEHLLVTEDLRDSPLPFYN